MPWARSTGFQVRCSVAMRADSAAGELANAVMPDCAKVADNAGRAMAACNAPDRPATVSFAMPPGAKNANHSLTTRFGWPCSTKVGTSGKYALRVAPELASTRTRMDAYLRELGVIA